MFVMFKSDKNGSYTGFSASYNAINYLATTAGTTTEVKNTHSLESTPFSGEPTPSSSGPTKLGGNKDQRKQSEEKDFNMVAVVVPVVALAFLVALFVAGFFYYKRRRTKNAEQETTKQVVYSRSNGETPMSLENPFYDRGGTPMSVENVCYDSNLIVEHTARSSEENHLYTEIDEESKNKKDKYMSQKNKNPLYETAVDDAVFNPIYDSST